MWIYFKDESLERLKNVDSIDENLPGLVQFDFARESRPKVAEIYPVDSIKKIEIVMHE